MPRRRPITPRTKRPASTLPWRGATEAQLHRLLFAVLDTLADALSRGETKTDAAMLAAAVKLLRVFKVTCGTSTVRDKAAVRGYLLTLRDRLGRG